MEKDKLYRLSRPNYQGNTGAIGGFEFYEDPIPPIIRTKGISAGSGKAWGVGGVPYGL